MSDKLLLKINTYYKLLVNQITALNVSCSLLPFSNSHFTLTFSPENAVHDFGDLSFEHPEEDDRFMNVPFPRTVGRANQILSDAMSRAVGAGHTAVMLGGDHR